MACRSLNYCPGDILEMDLHQWASAPISWSKCKCSLLSLRCIWQGCLSAPKCCWSPSVPYILINSPFMVACKCTEIVGNTGCVGWILHLVLSWFYQLAYIFEIASGCTSTCKFPSAVTIAGSCCRIWKIFIWSWCGLGPTALGVCCQGFPLTKQTTNHLPRPFQLLI